jgi:hypothetical protein
MVGPADPAVEARVGVLENTMGIVREDVASLKSELNTDVAEIRRDLKEMRDILTNRLPVWATLFIGFLTMMSGGLLGALITVLITA